MALNCDIIGLTNTVKTAIFNCISNICVIEDEESPFKIAEKLNNICKLYDIPYAFKGSYRKANRSRLDSFMGIGDEKALNVLKNIKKEFNIPVVTDIHAVEEAQMAADYDVDILQIPAFLCRQNDLLIAAAKTSKIVNIKKGQFLSGVTHSLQQPNHISGVTGGKPEHISLISKAAIAAVGADGIFMETHPNPKEAKSDDANMLRLDFVEPLLEQLVRIKNVI